VIVQSCQWLIVQVSGGLLSGLLMEPITLTPLELTEVLEVVSPTGIHYQAGRICSLLAHEKSVRTGKLASACSVGNISDIVQKSINPKIESLDLFVGCMKPPEKLTNKFGQRTGDHYWSFYCMPEAANDASYDGLEEELETVKQSHPELAGESDAHSWIGDLQRTEDVFADLPDPREVFADLTEMSDLLGDPK
jgi:hypothetical protein